jgi:O-antigen/teichoic acid export membrane protein
MGLDAGFLRLYYDAPDAPAQRRLTGTVAAFAAAAATLLLAAVAASAPRLARLLLGDEVPGGPTLLLLAAADVYLGTFTFVPQALLRIRDRALLFASLNAGRNLLNTALKVALVVSGCGVPGVLLSDLLATGAFALALLPLLFRNATWSFEGARLREVLRFGLPKAPHGLMLQLLNLGDRKILEVFRDVATVGVYDKAYVLGAGVKFGLSAFEPAWQPFVYAQIGKPEAPRTLARVVTYAWTGFTALALVIAVFGAELLRALTFTNSAFWAGAPVVPVVALAYLLHGAFLLTSIGIGISKDTRYYPRITLLAAAANLLANLALVPEFGMMGAAWATVFAYAVMAASGFVLSHRLYAIPFEGERLLRVLFAAGLSYMLSWFAPEPLVGALAFKLAACAAFPAVLMLSGFLSAEERAWLARRIA